MMHDFRSLLEVTAAPLSLAMLGGLARVCRYGAKSWKQFVGSIIVSGFTGVVVHLILQETSLSSSIQAAIVATSGYSGGAIIDAFVERLIVGVKNLPGPGAGADCKLHEVDESEEQ